MIPTDDLAADREPSPGERPRRARSALLVCALAALPLLPTLRAAYVYDDGAIIRDNPLLRGWDSLVRVWRAEYWPIGGSGLYRPLHLALLSVVWNLGGGRPVWFHVYAMLLAALTALAVWWLCRRAVAGVAAFAAATWFATQPLHVEAAASVANSSELLVVLCTVGLVAVLVRARASRGDALLIALLSAGALMAKETGVVALPLAAFTAWGWRRGVVSWRQFVEERKRSWLSGALAMAAVFVARRVVLGAGGPRVGVVAPGLVGLDGAARSAVVTSLWPHIAAMMAWPERLAPYYGPSILPGARMTFAAVGLLGCLGLVAAAVSVWRRGDARPAVALVWIALTWLPASNLLAPTGPLLADRTLFGATVGVALIVAWAIDRLGPTTRRVAAGVVLLLAARNAVESALYARDWTSHRTLWSRLVRNVPAEHLGYRLLGMDARARGDTAESLRLLGRSFMMAPDDATTRFELGQTLYARARYGEAAQVLGGLMSNQDALGRRELVAMYLDAVGRAGGAEAVVNAATPLMATRAAEVAGEYRRAALERRRGP